MDRRETEIDLFVPVADCRMEQFGHRVDRSDRDRDTFCSHLEITAVQNRHLQVMADLVQPSLDGWWEEIRDVQFDKSMRGLRVVDMNREVRRQPEQDCVVREVRTSRLVLECILLFLR